MKNALSFRSAASEEQALASPEGNPGGEGKDFSFGEAASAFRDGRSGLRIFKGSVILQFTVSEGRDSFLPFSLPHHGGDRELCLPFCEEGREAGESGEE